MTLTGTIAFIRSPLGTALAITLSIGIVLAIVVWKVTDRVENKVQREVLENKVEEQVQAIQEMNSTADKVKRATDAKNNVRNRARASTQSADRLLEDDGYLRKD